MRSIALVIAGPLCVAAALDARAEDAPLVPAPPPTAAPLAAADPPAPTQSVSATATTAPPTAATAAPQTSPGPLTLAGITISGSLDAYASINPARDASNAGPNGLYAFETQANGASVSFAKIALERKPAPVGFRLDIGFGPTIDIVNSTDAASGMGHDLMRNLEQAYVSWAATPSLTLKVGKMVTHHGMEVIESQANWNYTHSLLFTWAIPFTETGVALDWVVNDKLETSLFVVNGLNNTFEGNAFKSPGLQVIYKPSSAWTLTQNFSAFNEQPGVQGGLTRFDQAVYLFDTVATYAVSDAFEVAANSDVGYDASLPSDRVYAGIAAYGRWHANAQTAVSARAEYFHDNDSPTLGILLPMKGDIAEGTATLSYAPANGLLLRAETRVDRGLGSYKPFTDRAGMMYSSAQQSTVTLGAVAAF